MPRDPIFIVEDDENLVDAFSAGLKARGFDVAVQDCVFGAAARIRELRPLVVILDIGLPYRPGTVLLDELKRDPRTANVPVLVISGMTEVLSAERRALANRVLTKPFRLDTLVDAISSVCAGERVA